MTCQRCGDGFPVPPSRVRGGGGKFCSGACYSAHQREHPHGGRGAVALPSITRQCRACRADFLTSASQPRTYCSKGCAHDGRSVTKRCPACQRDFTVRRSYADRYNFCSRACSLSASGNIDHTCDRCGTSFRASPNRRFCSEVCRRPPRILACRTCTVEFRALPGETSRQFCSFRCYRRFRGETQPERFMREALTDHGVAYLQEWRVPGTRWLVDFLLPTLGIAIELDGAYWHEKIASRDALKDRSIEAERLSLVRIPVTGYVAARTTRAFVARLLMDHDAVAGFERPGFGPVEFTMAAVDEKRMIVGRRDRAIA